MVDRRSKETALTALRARLTAATQTRSQRPDTVTTPNGPEPAWVVYERGVMLDATNRIRAQHGLPPVDLAAIERIDNSAAGHIDWLDKFALRCAALAVGETSRD